MKFLWTILLACVMALAVSGAGAASTAATYNITDLGSPYHAFLWSGGQMTDLGTLGGNYSQGNGINLSGQVVGWADLKTGFSDSALWSGKTVKDLGATGANGINDLGEIVGTC